MTRHGSAEHVNTCRGLRLDQERPEERDEIGKGRTRSGGQGARVLKEVRHDEPDAAHHCRVLSDRLSDLRLAAVVVMREARVMDHPSRKQRTRAWGEHRGRDGRRVPRSDPARMPVFLATSPLRRRMSADSFVRLPDFPHRVRGGVRHVPRDGRVDDEPVRDSCPPRRSLCISGGRRGEDRAARRAVFPDPSDGCG